MNVFTREEQEKLGLYGLHPVGTWSPEEDILLRRHWALSESGLFSSQDSVQLTEPYSTDKT
jgi:hypothetical protein